MPWVRVEVWMIKVMMTVMKRRIMRMGRERMLTQMWMIWISITSKAFTLMKILTGNTKTLRLVVTLSTLIYANDSQSLRRREKHWIRNLDWKQRHSRTK
jgi:hypothetical protein